MKFVARCCPKSLPLIFKIMDDLKKYYKYCLSIRFVTFPIIKYPSKENNIPGIAKSDFTEKITGEDFCHEFPLQY